MSQENTGNIFFDQEEGEIIESESESENDEESKEDDEEDELEEAEWGGTDRNEVIIPNINILTYIGINPLGVPLVRVPIQSDDELSSTNLGRIRRREESSVPLEPNKVFRNIDGKRIIKKREHYYSYLCLKSGEEFYFNEEDDKTILLNGVVEPNKLIRNIISRVPWRISERLEYLAKFDSEEESDSEDENGEKVQKRYLGNLKELVYEAYIKEYRLRYYFKRVLILWRIYKMNRSCERELDPITLCEPEKEIYLYDWDNKKKFIFDAKSLATLIESKLMYQECGFPVPMYPRNPKNNVEFSYKQMISLYYQLKNHGELRWGFTTLREYNFNKHRWHMYHKSALTINSIKVSITLLDTIDGRELFSDFIFAKMEELGFRYTNTIVNIYNIAMIRLPNHWYLEKIKSLAISHYEGEHFGQNRIRVINDGCRKIFKKHNQFINDLKNKKIIN
jgi:hypothetical protein